jgi:hypothetical protein
MGAGLLEAIMFQKYERRSEIKVPYFIATK